MINSTKLAHSLVRQLIELGVSDFVVSPGSRNAPLLIALGEAADKKLIDLHVKIDERGAAFFALGISKASNNYVAVICTSGTAAANFLPAALESVHGGNHLLIITADRPERLRKTGANQTTNQVDLFQFIKTHDISSDIEIRNVLDGGPVHLNIQFDEPLLPEGSVDWLAGLKINQLKINNKVDKKLEVSTGVLVIGHDRGGYSKQEINSFVSKLKWPVISEDPLTFENSIPFAALYLSDPKISEYLKPDTVISIGRTTLSRSINTFINSINYKIVIDPRIKGLDSNRSADLVLSELPNEVVSQDCSNAKWVSISKITGDEVGKIAWSEQQAVITICDLIPDESALFIGSSRPIRDVEAFAKPRSGIEVFANRGLAGIDGNISTIFGVSEKFNKTFAILGDLSLLHDISAFTNAPKSNLRIFVIDNNGGGIFSTLPQSNVNNFEMLFGTPHNLDLSSVVSGFGVSVSKVTNLSELESAVSKELKGLDVVVVSVPSREENAKKLKEITQRVSSAVRIGINLA